MNPTTPDAAKRFEDLPNIGPSIAQKIREAGLVSPSELAECDPYDLFDRIQIVTGKSCDPCLLDVLISANRFLNGEPAQPWWNFTEERKKTLGKSGRHEP